MNRMSNLLEDDAVVHFSLGNPYHSEGNVRTGKGANPAGERCLDSCRPMADSGTSYPRGSTLNNELVHFIMILCCSSTVTFPIMDTFSHTRMVKSVFVDVLIPGLS